MKWLTLAGILLYLSRHTEAGALKCTPESQEPSCLTEKTDILPVQRVVKQEIETSSADVQCEAGSEWDSNCHTCHCSESGRAECVRHEYCVSEDIGEPTPCKPFTTFTRGCNKCTCLIEGNALCTVKSCPSHKGNSQMQCQPQSTWKSGCNTCRCTVNGAPACTRRGCFTRSHVSDKSCAPGSKWNNDCNSCVCTPEGEAMCTEKKCISIEGSNLNKNGTSKSGSKKDEKETSKSNATLTRRTRAAQEPPKTCQPGQEFRMDCNKCLCDNEGKDFSCTRIDCNAQNNNGGGGADSLRRRRDLSEQVTTQCVPGSVFDRDCNVCRCTTDGMHATCTLKRCKHETAEAETEPTPSFRCTPGDQFKRDCNDCTCSADGKTVFCTLRLCDQELADM